MKITNKKLAELRKFVSNMKGNPVRTSSSEEILIKNLKKEKLKCNECGKVIAELYVYARFNPIVYNDEAYCLDCGRLKKLKE